MKKSLPIWQLFAFSCVSLIFTPPHAFASLSPDCASVFADDGDSIDPSAYNFKKYHPVSDGIIPSMQLNAQETAWASHYFPFEKGGVATRWQEHELMQTPEVLIDENPDLTRVTKNEARARLLAMTAEQLAKLSPAEKMDIYLGNYDFQITRLELEKRGPRREPKPEEWEGFCNGVCAAAINQPEPKTAVTVKNPDGIEVRFEPADIKALLSASYFYVEKYAQIGEPNNNPKLKINPVTLPNAGVFDHAITDYLGKLRIPFVIDLEPGAEIWNFVVVGYDRTLGEIQPVLSPIKGAPKRTRFQVAVSLQVKYVDDLEPSAINLPTADAIASGKNLGLQTYTYTLYLNSKQQVIGGVFTSEKAPDFAWFPKGKGMDQSMGENRYLPFEAVSKLNRLAQGQPL